MLVKTYARLGRAGDRLPWGNRWFGHGTDIPGYEIIEPFETLTAALVADGSIVIETPPSSAAQEAPETPEHS
jgi:hypothetical protein